MGIRRRSGENRSFDPALRQVRSTISPAFTAP